MCSFPIPRSPGPPTKEWRQQGAILPWPPSLPFGGGGGGPHRVMTFSVSTHAYQKNWSFSGKVEGRPTFVFGTATPHTHAQGLRGPGHLLP